MLEKVRTEVTGGKDKALSMMREGLAIQMYNELCQYSEEQTDLVEKKSALFNQLEAMNAELAKLEKKERMILHEIQTRKTMLKKLAVSFCSERERQYEIS